MTKKLMTHLLCEMTELSQAKSAYSTMAIKAESDEKVNEYLQQAQKAEFTLRGMARAVSQMLSAHNKSWQTTEATGKFDGMEYKYKEYHLA